MKKPKLPSKAMDLPTLIYIEKTTMRLYKLIKLTLDNDVVVKTDILATDLPDIIVGKYLRELRNAGFKNDWGFMAFSGPHFSFNNQLPIWTICKVAETVGTAAVRWASEEASKLTESGKQPIDTKRDERWLTD